MSELPRARVERQINREYLVVAIVTLPYAVVVYGLIGRGDDTLALVLAAVFGAAILCFVRRWKRLLRGEAAE